MGSVRPRRWLVTAAVLAAALLWTGVAESRSGSTTVVTATVSAEGVHDAPAGWTVAHPSPGVYRVAGEGSTLELDVTSWDTEADVTIVPLGEGITEVRFDLDGVALDARFAFTALAGD